MWMSINKVLMEHNHTHSFTYYLSMATFVLQKLNSYERNSKAHELKIFSL